MEIPEDIINKIILYMRHPVVDLIKHDRHKMVFRGYGQTWYNFVRLHLSEYKERCRKKPLHGKVMFKFLRSYTNYKSFCKDDKIKPKSFYKYMLPQNDKLK